MKTDPQTTIPPLEFVDNMHDWMAEHTGGNTLGHETIARLVWKYFVNTSEYMEKHYARKV